MIGIPKEVAALRGLELVWAERLRQKEVKGYTPAHDDDLTGDELALLAAAYALSSRSDVGPDPALSYLRGILKEWDWGFKPADPIRDLTRAGALIQAELERRLRAKDK